MNVKARLEKIERQVMAQSPAPDDESTLTPAERYRHMLDERPCSPLDRRNTQPYTPEQAYAILRGLPVPPSGGGIAPQESDERTHAGLATSLNLQWSLHK